MKDKPNIVVIGMGGTIAGRGASATDISAYDCSVVGIDEILMSIPEASSLANLRAEQLLQVGSENFNEQHLLMIGKRISEVLRNDTVDGVVLTHGTDTIEETAYFLHLTLKKPETRRRGRFHATAIGDEFRYIIESLRRNCGSHSSVLAREGNASRRKQGDSHR